MAVSVANGYHEEWVELEKVMGQPDLPEDPDALREAFNGALIHFATLKPPTNPDIQTKEEQVSANVKVRIYTPPDASGKKLPAIVFLHGGGWRAGNLDTEDHLCRTVCSEVPMIVVSVEYRIFPWVKYPAEVDDCYEAYQWTYDHVDELGADRKRLSIWGGSAGAALAVAVTHRLVSSGQGDRISGLVNMSGTVVHPDAVPEEYKHLHKSYVENGGPVPVVDGKKMLEAYEEIAPQYREAEFFPVSGGAKALKGFPKTYITSTSKEANRDDGLVMEHGLKDAGVEVKRDVFKGLPHYYWCFPVVEASQDFRYVLVQGIKWLVDAQ